MSSSDTAVHLSKINIQDTKEVGRVDVFINEARVDVKWKREGKGKIATFSPPLALASSQVISIRPNRRTSLGSIFQSRSIPKVDISPQDLLRTPRPEHGNRRAWRKVLETTEVTVLFTTNDDSVSHAPSFAGTETSTLRPVTEDILRICPRFRILVIGKTGVGKSSLINQAFGVNQALVEHNKRGQADINQEIFSQENDMFVLHDSLGFEPGEGTNFQIAKDFIKKRNERPQIKDKLHAIWLCFEIPTAGGRVIETGAEVFLGAKVEGELGDVPVIGVFTKYDKLVNSEMFSLASNRQIAQSNLIDLAEEAAELALQNKCFGPFKECLRGRDVPYVKVSTNPKYPDSKATLEALVSLTQDLVVEYIRDAGLVTGMAQRASPDVSIKTSVEVGKRKYWKSLLSSFHFPGKTLQQCLDVIHTDIVTVWNFNDPNKYLHCEAFRQMLYEIVDNSSKNTSPRGRTYLASGLSIVGTLAGILSALAGPAAPIVVPIAATVVVIVWLREVYKESRITLQRLMTYIVHLTLVMQIIFWLQVVLEMEDPKISRRIVKLAITTYTKSGEKEQIEWKIKDYADKANMTDSEAAFNKIDAVLKESRINYRAGLEKKDLATRFDSAAEDEQWDYQEANQL